MSPNDILHDCSSDSDDNKPPSTPQPSMMIWPPHDIVSMEPTIPHSPLHRATSYANFEQQANGQHAPQQYANRQGTPSNAHQEFHGQPITNYYIGAPTLRRTTTMPCQIYYVPEQGRPGVATMTNTAQPHYQLPKQVEIPPMELPYSILAITASIQSNPSTSSTTSVSSPIGQEYFYEYLPGNKPEYAQGDPQQSIGHYQHPMQYLMSHSEQPVASQTQLIHAPSPDHSPPKPARAQQEQCSNYDLPIEARTIGQLQTYETAVYNPYRPRIEVADSLMQFPNSSIVSL
ncbi:hypothetical protein FVEN_g9525 [Fusarium venenatum]|uniref:Uncharacterized protein n=2 Tax=Fusarium venenatum TaxID=56646 RepID=A0A2L2TZA9_9HYPO|nr:uncharacterized protein FVRRES_04222 [Fusarium venenatum]KAG8352504.1 hypothetical protein FVEN_g9525 [Fusarium venenatum]CEI67710.1 unnamed protein product [Fusarium venenatum]